ncbi:MAG TPA: hypothetical protein VMV71_04010 [Candidatus Paceibacterota bacterium]|nr:hypothetical protein [Candidatus Paceibacterota bacterium]
MKKKNTKNNIPSNAGFGVVLEHIDSKLDLVVEGHKGLDKKIDKSDKKVDDLRGEMNYKFGVVFDELHLIRNDLKEKVSRDEFVFLEKRVSALEKKR